MEGLRDVFMGLAGLLVIAGSLGVVVLEFGSSANRRLVSRLRDTVEVLLPPVLVVLLIWLVWLGRP